MSKRTTLGGGRRLALLALLAAGLGGAGLGGGVLSGPALGQTYTVFDADRIGFGGDQSREIQRTVTFPEFGPNDRLTFDWDLLADQDPWDRAGSIHLIMDNGQQVQLGKFATGFRGTTSHQEDVSDLAPLLSGQTVTIEAHIDTWVGDAWRLNAALQVEPGVQTTPNATWAAPIISRDGGLGWHESGDVSRRYTATIPSNMESVKLTYFASGHHHNQTSASDEFNQRRHHLIVDGQEVWTGIPWRTDGPNFRSVNPTSGRWDGNGDGDTNDPYPIDQWSSDYPRSGWVPGDEVHPYEIDVTPYLSLSRRHSVELLIEDVDINSYWRVSAYLSGVAYPAPELPGDFNLDGVVDAADYTLWRDQEGTVERGNPADADQNNAVNVNDYNIWKANYGQTLAGQSEGQTTAVPEPMSLSLIALGAAAWTRPKRARRRDAGA